MIDKFDSEFKDWVNEQLSKVCPFDQKQFIKFRGQEIPVECRSNEPANRLEIIHPTLVISTADDKPDSFQAELDKWLFKEAKENTSLNDLRSTL